MPLSLPTISPLGPPLLEWIDDGRLRVTRRYGVPEYLTRSTEYKKWLIRPLGTLDTEPFEGFAKPTYLTFPDCVLVRSELSQKDPYNRTALPEVLTEVFEEAKDELTQVDVSEETAAPDGTRRVQVVLVNKTAKPWDRGIVGETVYLSGEYSGILEREEVRETPAVRTVVRTFITKGILEASRRQWEEGLLLVRFVAVGEKRTPTALKTGASFTDEIVDDHTGGAQSLVIREDCERVMGLRVWTVEIALKSDGSAISDTEDTLLSSKKQWVEYTVPGCVSVDEDAGFILTPPKEKMWLCTVEVWLGLSENAGPKPYRVKEWATANLAYTPLSTGVGVARAASYRGYLAGTSIVGIGTIDVLGNPSRNVVGTVSSNPAFADWSILGKVIENNSVFLFSTSTGKMHYRRIVVKVDATQPAEGGENGTAD